MELSPGSFVVETPNCSLDHCYSPIANFISQCNIAFEARLIQCEMKWRYVGYLVSLSIIDKISYFLSKIIQ